MNSHSIKGTLALVIVLQLLFCSPTSADPLILESPDVPVYSLALSQDGALVAGLSSGTLSVWRLDSADQSKRPIARIDILDNQSFDPKVYSAPLVLSPKGDRVAVPIAKANPPSAFATVGVQIWDISDPAQPKLSATFMGEENMQTSNGYYAFSPDGKDLAVAINAKLELLNLTTGKKRGLSTEPWAEADTQFIRYAADGKKIGTMRKDGLVKLWDVENGRVLGSGKIDTSVYKITDRQARSGTIGVDMGTLSPDLKFGTVIDRGKTEHLSLWDITKGKRLREIVKLNDSRERIITVLWSQDGRRIVYFLSTLQGAMIGVYDVSEKKEVLRLKADRDLYTTALSGNARFIAASSPSTKRIVVWDIDKAGGKQGKNGQADERPESDRHSNN